LNKKETNSIALINSILSKNISLQKYKTTMEKEEEKAQNKWESV